ncbi:hypothetical protein CC78DRAFT_539616 [Lojkania enalia]|uniref:Uncharacterized protein n=1 Tax=Lojkania enalia TaxID=147567 RepID=A0A9P4TNV1_9PLEO|nr:hypothetical protein CC78DRAFT_539616 [Didymosphaeria enalia]
MHAQGPRTQRELYAHKHMNSVVIGEGAENWRLRAVPEGLNVRNKTGLIAGETQNEGDSTQADGRKLVKSMGCGPEYESSKVEWRLSRTAAELQVVDNLGTQMPKNPYILNREYGIICEDRSRARSSSPRSQNKIKDLAATATALQAYNEPPSYLGDKIITFIGRIVAEIQDIAPGDLFENHSSPETDAIAEPQSTLEPYDELRITDNPRIDQAIQVTNRRI